MDIVLKQIKMIKRIDQLIRLQATGSSDELAYRLGVSKTTLYRMIRLMKELHAPIVYDISVQSFVYTKEVELNFGFCVKNEVRVKSKYYIR